MVRTIFAFVKAKTGFTIGGGSPLAQGNAQASQDGRTAFVHADMSMTKDMTGEHADQRGARWQAEQASGFSRTDRNATIPINQQDTMVQIIHVS